VRLHKRLNFLKQLEVTAEMIALRQVPSRELFKLSIILFHLEKFNRSFSLPTENDLSFKAEDKDSNLGDITLQETNAVLIVLDESPLTNRKRRSSTYLKTKSEKIAKKLHIDSPPNAKVNCVNCDTMMNILLTQYNSCKTKGEKMVIVSTAIAMKTPLKKIVRCFNCTLHFARCAKKHFKSKGLFVQPEKFKRNSACKAIEALVIEFYNCDENTKLMPGLRDRIIIREIVDGIRVKRYEQKRVLLDSVSALFKKFKLENPYAKIGKSKFYQLKPKYVVSPDKAALRTCLCIKHENAKLLFKFGGIETMTADTDVSLKSLTDCIACMVCEDPNEDCYESLCKDCPGPDLLSDFLLQLYDANNVKEVRYQLWITENLKCELKTITQTVDDYIESFMESLQTLKLHHHTNESQMSLFKVAKESLKEGEVLLICDFAENYTFTFQDEVQAAHWAPLQATLHCSVAYFKDGDTLKHCSHIGISPEKTHDANTAHLYISKCIARLKKDKVLPWPLTKVKYFSDGAPSQYKNFKNLANMCMHKNDHGVPCKWYFFASGHGKSACDGLGGTTKALARRAASRKKNPYQITTCKELYNFLSLKMPRVKFDYVEKREHALNKRRLESRYKKFKTLPGLRQYHMITPLPGMRVRVRKCSTSNECNTLSIKK
jgi:hypothetical protein